MGRERRSISAASRSAVLQQESFTVCNEGTSVMDLGQVSVPTGFSVTQSLPATLAAGQCASLIVSMNSSAAGTYAGQLTIDDATASTSDTFSFPVTGGAADPTSALAVVLGTTQISNGQATAIGFGSESVRAAVQQESFTVCNEGTSVMDLGQVRVPQGLFGEPVTAGHAGGGPVRQSDRFDEFLRRWRLRGKRNDC